jgi:molecular chaperone GrpE
MADPIIDDIESLLETPEATAETTPEATEETPPESAIPESGDTEKIQKLAEALARATADYQNLLKRSENERREMAVFFTESFVKKVLPTLDNLDRVVTGTPAELRTGAVYEGVKHAATGLYKALESMGVASFVSLGTQLDPNFHDAMGQGPGTAGEVVSEFEKGYQIGDKVIRHAKVIVGSGE